MPAAWAPSLSTAVGLLLYLPCSKDSKESGLRARLWGLGVTSGYAVAMCFPEGIERGKGFGRRWARLSGCTARILRLG
jgi:hypothetical protein